MSKELFVETLKFMEELRNKSMEVDKALKSLSSDFGGFYLDEVFTKFEEILCKVMDDEEEDIIGYWLWELDFGKEYEPGCIIENNKIIMLETPEELYDYLVGRDKK